MQDSWYIFDIPKFKLAADAEIKWDNETIIRTSIVEMSLKQGTGLLLPS